MRYLKYLLWGGNNPEKEAPNSVTIPTGSNGILQIVSAAPSVLAPGTTGNVPTSNGTSWVSSAPTGGSSFSDYFSYTYFGGF